MMHRKPSRPRVIALAADQHSAAGLGRTVIPLALAAGLFTYLLVVMFL